MVVDGAQVEDMIGGRRLAGARENTLFVDMSTIAPGDRARARRALREAGHAFVDAPVTGSSPKAEAGTLTIMCGGADADVERARPLFEVMGEKIVHVRRGRPGPGRQGASRRRSRRSTAPRSPRRSSSRRQAGVDLDALLRGHGRRLVRTPRCARSRAGRCSSTTSRRCSSSRTCSRTSSCASRRRAAAGAPFPFAGAGGASSTAPGVGRGLGDQDFAAVLEVVEGLAGTSGSDDWRIASSALKSCMSVKIVVFAGNFEILGTCA